MTLLTQIVIFWGKTLGAGVTAAGWRAEPRADATPSLTSETRPGASGWMDFRMSPTAAEGAPAAAGVLVRTKWPP